MILTPEERRALLVLAALLAFGQVLAAWQRYRDARPDRDLSAWLERIAEAREAGADALPGSADSVAGVIVAESRGAMSNGEASNPAMSNAPASAVSALRAPGSQWNAGAEFAAGESDSARFVAGKRNGSPPSGGGSRERATRLRPAKEVPPGILEGGKLGIDQASAQELEALPGVGPALAARIIAEREARPFTQVEDLKRVKGIGPKTFERLLPWVQISASFALADSTRTARN